MKFTNRSIVSLMIFSTKAFHNTGSENTTLPLVITSSQVKRLLNTCETFEYNIDSDTWYVDGDTNKLTLEEACHKDTGLDCCNTCKGGFACWGIAANAKSGSVVINSNACKQGTACYQIGYNIKEHLDVEVGSAACDGPRLCRNIGYRAQFLTRIEVPPDECLEDVTVHGITSGKCSFCGAASTFTGDFVATDECCAADGLYYQDHPNNDYYDDRCNGSQAPSNLPSSMPSNFPSDIPSDIPSDQPSSLPSSIPSDMPSDIPSDQPSSLPSESAQPSSIPSSSPSKLPSLPPVEPPSPCANQKCNDAGKCEVKSTTEFRCVCETTFINSANGRSCVCPAGFIRKSDNRCYDPATPSPISLTKTPTASPVSKTFVSSSPSKAPTDDCNDYEDAKFYLIKKPRKSVKCFWLTKNTARTGKRIANFCGLNRVKNICKSTCSFCTCDDDDSFSFKMINREKNKTCGWLTRNQKKRAKRIERYCTEKFDDGSVMNACTKSCGLCG